MLNQNFDSDFQKKLEEQTEATQYNVLKITQEFTLVRYYLDVAVTKDTQNTSKHIFGVPFMSFWIIRWSDATFDASVWIGNNPTGNALPLFKNFSNGWDYRVGKATFEWSAQSGKWFDVAYFHNSKCIPGTTNFTISSILDGTGFDDPASFELSSLTPAPVDSSGANVRTIYNHGPDICWVGSSSCDATDLQERGSIVPVGQERRFENTGNIYGSSKGTSRLSVQRQS